MTLKQGQQEMLSTEELQTVKIKTVDEGKDLLLDIKVKSGQLLYEMQNTPSIPEWTKLNDERYELKKARFNIQSQMTKIVKERMKNGV